MGAVVRIIVAVGARPNAVKVAPLLPALKDSGFEVQVAYTGSRNQSLGDSEGGSAYYGVDLIEPQWFLDIGTGTQAMLTGRAMIAFEELFGIERPDAVMVVGDVSATLAAAVSAAKAGISVVHLEAGLRCGDLRVPDEVNRVLVSRVAAMHLTPTEDALDALEGEGVDPQRIHFVGSILAESVIRHLDRVDSLAACAGLGVDCGEFVLGSFHRPENLASADRLRAIVDGLGASSLPTIIPDADGLRDALAQTGVALPDNVRVVEAVPYLVMLALEASAAVVVTDSAGVQEEACIVGTPCLTVREQCEVTETFEVGASSLVPADARALASEIAAAVSEKRSWVVPKRWDRAVSERVVRALKRGIIPLR